MHSDHKEDKFSDIILKRLGYPKSFRTDLSYDEFDKVLRFIVYDDQEFPIGICFEIDYEFFENHANDEWTDIMLEEHEDENFHWFSVVPLDIGMIVLEDV